MIKHYCIYSSDGKLVGTTSTLYDPTSSLLDGQYLQEVASLDSIVVPEKIRDLSAQAAFDARGQRNLLLQESDWTQVPDAPVDADAWKAYRQALRDITNQAGFPDKIDWPIKPE